MTPDALRILIADDDAGDRKNLRRAIRTAMPESVVRETEDFESAKSACIEEKFDCVILDYRMPGRDGLAGIAELSKQFPYLSIIMITGQGDETVAVKALQLGAQDYIPKDHIDVTSIRRIVEHAVEKTAMKRELDRQRRDLEEFAYALAHDLKAPVRAVRAFTQMMVRDTLAQKFERLPDHEATITRNSDNLVILVDTLSQYLKVGGDVRYETVSLAGVLDDALQNLAGDIKASGTRISRGDLPDVCGNASELTRVFQNIIGNAVKYNRSETPEITVNASITGAMCSCAIGDNGIGIRQAHFHTIFKPFKRLHGNSEYQGTGLGLAFCRKIIEAHGGEIWCESGAEQGTTFHFTIPLSANSQSG